MSGFLSFSMGEESSTHLYECLENYFGPSFSHGTLERSRVALFSVFCSEKLSYTSCLPIFLVRLVVFMKELWASNFFTSTVEHECVPPKIL